MISLILRTVTRFLMPLMLMFSIFLLLRGHQLPGGGFSGGLVAAAAFALYLLAYDVVSVRRILGISPQALIGIGLLFAAMSGILSWFVGASILTGQWIVLKYPGGEISLGTPFLFDVGVYLVAFGSSFLTILSLWEE